MSHNINLAKFYNAISLGKENNAVVLSSLDNNEVDPRLYKDYEPGDLS